MSAHARSSAYSRSPHATTIGIVAASVVIVALFAIDLYLPMLFSVPLPERAVEAIAATTTVLLGVLPFVILGAVLSIVVQVWLPAGDIAAWLPQRGWARRAVLSLLGLVIPVGEGGNVPFARGLMMRGLAPAEALTFVMAAPIVNPIVILTTHAAFGWDGAILVMRLLGGFVIANLIGWIYSRHPSPDALLTTQFVSVRARVAVEPGTPMRRSLTQFLTELRALMPALIVGSAFAGALQLLIPGALLEQIASNPPLAVLAMIAAGLIISVGSHADSFVALSFASAFSPGALVAFLLVGPLVDVKTLALLRTTFTTRTLVGVVAVVLFAAFAVGMGVSVVV